MAWSSYGASRLYRAPTVARVRRGRWTRRRSVAVQAPQRSANRSATRRVALGSRRALPAFARACADTLSARGARVPAQRAIDREHLAAQPTQLACQTRSQRRIAAEK